MVKEKDVGGRPTKYKPEYDEQMYKFALLGATDEEAAAFFDIDIATFYRWKASIPSFCDAIKEGKEKADAQVANRLYNRALGYDYTETKIEREYDELLGDFVEVKKVVTNKHAPPDIAAMNIWLKNRRGMVNPLKGIRWADKHEHKIEGDLGLDFSKMSTEELLKRAEAINKIEDAKK